MEHQVNISASRVHLYFPMTPHLRCLVSTSLSWSMYGTHCIGCSCHPNGSLEQCCDPRGGQCPCRAPVGTNIQPYGLDCNTCPRLFHGPTSTGCIGRYMLPYKLHIIFKYLQNATVSTLHSVILTLASVRVLH